MKLNPFIILSVDPQGKDAMDLLREAAIEARAIYPELFNSDSEWPANSPIHPRGIYLIGYLNDQPVASGALHPIDEETVEIQRIFVGQPARKSGFAQSIMKALEQKANELGFKTMRLETGYRQQAAMALYESYGFYRIEPFGKYRDDPTSVCYEKEVEGFHPN